MSERDGHCSAARRNKKVGVLQGRRYRAPRAQNPKLPPSTTMTKTGCRLAVRAAHRSISLSRRRLSTFSRIEQLKELIPDLPIIDNRYELERHGRGESYHPIACPDAVVVPRSTTEVQTVLRHCVRERIPVIPFGTGTSVEGHVAALHGGLSLDLGALQSMQLPSLDGDTLPDPYAIVGPGVTRKQLNEALRHTGLQFVVDPGADASIGGMVATGASGTSTVKYGGMRENILELECVLADPEATLVKTGTKSLKNSAGYDLVSLLCGSEGTLGVITSVTVKLHPVPDYIMAGICQFESLHEAAAAVATLQLRNVDLSRCELLDTTSVAAFNEYNRDKAPMIVKPTLFLEFQGHSETALRETVSLTEDICVKDYTGSSFTFASDEEDRRALWAARHTLYYASIAFRKGATGAIVTDCCVPLSKFADLIAETAKDVKAHGVVGPCFGHAGDGNLHCILPVRDDDSEEYLQLLETVNENLIRRTLAAGGSCTGEHGVGYGKIKYLERQYGPGAITMMRAIKQSLDPFNIMNPGKVVPMP